MISPNIRTGYVIVGPYNNVWCDQIFDTEQEAVDYLVDFWKGKIDMAHWRIAAGKKTLAVDVVITTAPSGIKTVADVCQAGGSNVVR